MSSEQAILNTQWNAAAMAVGREEERLEADRRYLKLRELQLCLAISATINGTWQVPVPTYPYGLKACVEEDIERFKAELWPENRDAASAPEERK